MPATGTAPAAVLARFAPRIGSDHFGTYFFDTPYGPMQVDLTESMRTQEHLRRANGNWIVVLRFSPAFRLPRSSYAVGPAHYYLTPRQAYNSHQKLRTENGRLLSEHQRRLMEPVIEAAFAVVETRVPDTTLLDAQEALQNALDTLRRYEKPYREAEAKAAAAMDVIAALGGTVKTPANPFAMVA